MGFYIMRRDITTMRTDAIVNAANSRLAPGGGVCGAIFAAAGYEVLDKACRNLGCCETGQAVITPGFSLSAKYIIHAVGPIWFGGTSGEARLLESCYLSALKLAAAHNCKSIAFPVISAGIYGYPKREALSIAIRTILRFLDDNAMEAYLTVFDHEMYLLAEEVLLEERKREVL